MQTFGQEVKGKAEFPNEKTVQLRYELIKEELEELKQAIKDVIKGCIKIKEIPVSSSVLYSHPTLLEYFKNKMKGVK